MNMAWVSNLLFYLSSFLVFTEALSPTISFIFEEMNDYSYLWEILFSPCGFRITNCIAFDEFLNL